MPSLEEDFPELPNPNEPFPATHPGAKMQPPATNEVQPPPNIVTPAQAKDKEKPKFVTGAAPGERILS